MNESVNVEDSNISSITIEDIDKLLERYFTTREEQVKQTELNKEQSQLQLASTEDFNTLMLNKLDTIASNIQYSTNLSFFAIVIALVIVIWSVMYKFLKIFF